MNDGYHIRLIAKLEDYAREHGAKRADWAAEIFDDVTDGGRRAQIRPAAPNDEGPLIILIGRRFSCIAGLDSRRPDTLFVVRVYDVALGLRQAIPDTSPRTTEGPFALIGVSDDPQTRRQPVEPLFDDRRISHTEAEFEAAYDEAPVSPPSDRLWEVLRELAQRKVELLDDWGPERPGAREKDLLEGTRSLMRLHRPERYIAIDRDPRTTGLLASVSPPVLSLSDRQRLRSVFDFDTLARLYATAEPKALKAFEGLVEGAAKLDLADGYRAWVWSAMATSLGAPQFIRRLHETAGLFASLSEQRQEQWWRPLERACLEVAQGKGSQILMEVVESCRQSPHPVASLAEWAGSLLFEHPGGHEIDDERSSPAEDAPAGGGEMPLSIDAAPSSHRTISTSDDAAPARPEAVEPGPGQYAAVAAYRRWLSARQMSPAALESVRARMREALVHAHDLLQDGGDDPLNTVYDIARAVAVLRQCLDGCHEVPDVSDIERDFEDTTALFRVVYDCFEGSAAHLFDPEADAPGNGAPLAIEELRQLSTILGAVHYEALPRWTLPGDGTPDGICRGLAGFDARQRFIRCLDVVRAFSDDEREHLLGAPPPRDAMQADFQAWAEDTLRSLTALDRIAEEHRGWATALMEHDLHGALDEIVTLLEQQRPRVSSEVYAAFTRWLATASDIPAAVASIKGAIDAMVGVIGEASVKRLADFSAFEFRLKQELEARTASEARSLEIQPDYVNLHGQHPHLSCTRMSKEEPYCLIRVPLLIVSTRPTAEVIQLNYELGVSRKALRQTLPAQHTAILPERIEPLLEDWHHDPELDRYVYEFDARVVVQPPTEEQSQIHLTISGETSAGPIRRTPQLKWYVWREHTEVDVIWPSHTVPDEVPHNPIGPQRHHATIRKYLEAAASVVALAPRRFGKTSLVEHLERIGDEGTLLIPRPEQCTKDYINQSFDAHNYWSRVLRNCHALEVDGLTDDPDIRISVTMDGPLPAARSFDRLRRLAAERGCKAAVIIIDEAHLMFPRRGGNVVATALKDRCEGYWSKPQADKQGRPLAPLVFCLVGLPALQDRAGNNAMAHFQVLNDNPVDEAALNRILLARSRNTLQTTRLARRMLVDETHNLFLLKTLVNRVSAILNQEHRIWCRLGDVISAKTQLIRELRKRQSTGDARKLIAYIRDALNGADSIDDWEPLPCLPVAIALSALPAREKSLIGIPRQLLTDQLRDWCRRVPSGARTVPIYTPERVDEHLTALKDLGVLDGHLFRSPFVEAWLRGLASSFPSDKADQDALFSGALKRIRIPEGCQPIGSGTQASVFRFEQAGRMFGLRKVVLDTEIQRRRFIEGLEILERIRDRLNRREPGSQYVFDLIDVGLAEGERAGVEIYAWIDGQSLSSFVGQLPEAAVIDLGVHLAEALVLLHGIGIIHRDISPANVIVEDAYGRPILIDFGFARCTRDFMATQADSVVAAPEVRAERPTWTTAADIFGLGATLEALLSADEPLDSPLRQLLDLCQSEAPSNRPDADQLRARFEQIGQQQSLSHQKAQIRDRIDALAEDDAGRQAEYGSVLAKFRPRFEMAALGFFEAHEVCQEVAAFLDQVLEATSPKTKKLKLGYVKDSNPHTGKRLVDDSILRLHKLRLERSHFLGGRRSERAKTAGDETREALIEEVRAGTRLLAEELRLASLPGVVDVVLDYCR